MIVPQLHMKDFADDRNSLRQQLEHWSLFGRVALRGIEEEHVEELEQITKLIGGSVDLLFELNQRSEGQKSEESMLRLLNAGASHIIFDYQIHLEVATVPHERILPFTSSGDDDATLKPGCLFEEPVSTGTRLAQLEQVRSDCLVDASVLAKQPEIIGDFFKAVLVSDRPDGLWSTIIVDPLGQALGLAYSNHESLMDALTFRRGTYWSRSRNGLWVKGATSGATQRLISVRMDCDRDCLRFQVTQDAPGFCHRNTHTCFGAERSIEAVVQRLMNRIDSADEKSFTKKLVNDPDMLRKKLLEEAEELLEADSPDEIAWEAADVLYFSLVKMLSQGVKLEQVYHELARRMNRVVRRGPGIKNK